MELKPEHEMHQRRKGRNYGVLAALGGLAVLLFAVTIVKMGPQAGNPSQQGQSWGDTLMQWVLE